MDMKALNISVKLRLRDGRMDGRTDGRRDASVRPFVRSFVSCVCHGRPSRNASI